MLVLSRKVGEKIWVGENTCITVVRVAQGVVRLGIDAPLDQTIVREELRQGCAEVGAEAICHQGS